MSLNPHQFGDQGTLFDAPLGQPKQGVFKGNPAARLYRNVGVPRTVAQDFQETGDVGYVTDHLNRAGKDAGVDRSLGIHWQHDLAQAKTHRWGPGDTTVVIEADHPGHEHVMDPHTDASVMEKTVSGVPGRFDEVLPEVPIRPGSPMTVHAVHVPLPGKDQPQAWQRGDEGARVWQRHTVKLKGQA